MRRQRRRVIPRGYYGIGDAARFSGLTRYMVDYLCRTGVLTPSGHRERPRRGSSRLYTFGDLVILRVLSHLLQAGIEVRKLKEALATLRSKHPEITPTSLPGKYLVTNGESLFFRARRNVVEDLTRDGQIVFAFVVEMRKVRDDVRARVGLRAAGAQGA